MLAKKQVSRVHAEFPRPKSYGIATLILLLFYTGVTADSVQYKPVSRQVVESRLGRYAGNDQQREATLKQNVW